MKQNDAEIDSLHCPLIQYCNRNIYVHVAWILHTTSMVTWLPAAATNVCHLPVIHVWALWTIEAINFIQQVIVLIPRDTCASMSVLCLQVMPGADAGWTDTSDDENIECIDITAMLDCDGKFWAWLRFWLFVISQHKFDQQLFRSFEFCI